MTTARSGTQKSRKPAHQNAFAFYHNKKSKKTQMIQAIPVEGVCSRCAAKIEWRKKYRKYKPLTQPRKCQVCEQKTVTRAYHFICSACSTARHECPMCRKDFSAAAAESADAEGEDVELLEKAQSQLRERERRQVARILERKGESAALEYIRALVAGGKVRTRDGGADDEDAAGPAEDGNADDASDADDGDDDEADDDD